MFIKGVFEKIKKIYISNNKIDLFLECVVFLLFKVFGIQIVYFNLVVYWQLFVINCYVYNL